MHILANLLGGIEYFFDVFREQANPIPAELREVFYISIVILVFIIFYLIKIRRSMNKAINVILKISLIDEKSIMQQRWLSKLINKLSKFINNPKNINDERFYSELKSNLKLELDFEFSKNMCTLKLLRQTILFFLLIFLLVIVKGHFGESFEIKEIQKTIFQYFFSESATIAFFYILDLFLTFLGILYLRKCKSEFEFKINDALFDFIYIEKNKL